MRVGASKHPSVEQAVARIKERFFDQLLQVGDHAGQVHLQVKRDRILELLATLKEDFDYLADLAGVDYLNVGMSERFCVVYNLYSFKHNSHLRVKAFIPEDDPTIDSVHTLWRAAPLAEREVYDQYGIVFKGHPHLKRLLNPDDYTGHPLRKDYPLRGMGERDNFPKVVRPTEVS